MGYGKDILLGSRKGLYLFKDNKFLHLGYKDSLLKSSIVEMTKDPDGYTWLATSGAGLLKFREGEKLIQFSEKDGLISNICTAVTRDDVGNIWVGTNKGISCIRQNHKDKSNWKIKNISALNGLNSNEITKLYADGNTLWVGTMYGLNKVNIHAVTTIAPAARTYIQAVKIGNRLIKKGENSFPYNQNNLKFTVDGLTFSDNTNHVYRYRLIGLNSNWEQTKTEEVLYNNLAPGNYTFQANVVNIDNVWNTTPASFSFTITKPFWSTWWFIVLEIIVLIVLIYLIIRSRTNVIRKKEQEKVRINKLLAEYQMKALTAQMNPHFIFNAINSIQNFIIQNHATLAYDYLVKFSKLIRLVLINSKENEITLQQEIDTLLLYMELEQLRFENSFDFQLTIDPQIDTDQVMIPALLAQPYIENAIWHGLMPLKNRKGLIALTFKITDGLLHIRITDNGVGRAASQHIKKKISRKDHQSVGMELTGKRVELFGENAVSSIQIVDNYNEENEAIGTTVNITLPIIEY